MDIRTLNLQLKFLSGKPVEIDNVLIYPITLEEISDIGYDEYKSLIHLLCIDMEQLISIDKDTEFQNVFDVLILYACQHQPTMDLLINAFKLVCKSEIKFDIDKLSFVTNTGEINRDNFLEFQNILKKRNGLENIEEDIDNPANAMAKMLLAKRKQAREKLKKAKTKQLEEDDENQITLSDLISILANGLKISLFEIFKYDMYQFNDQFNRLRIFNDYEVSVQALLHGADSKKTKLVHWISPIEQNNG